MYKELAIDKEIEVIKTIRELQNYVFTSINSMMECVEEDCTEPTDEDDAWCTDCNFQIVSNYGSEVTLQHRKDINLYASYKIHSVEVVE